MAYINSTWSDITTTTRENRSAEHGSLFTPTDPSKVGKPAPIHPIIPEHMVRAEGSYKTKKSKRK